MSSQQVTTTKKRTTKNPQKKRKVDDDTPSIIQIKKDIKLLKSEERGFRDTGLGGSDISTASSGTIAIPSINIVPQGDLTTERQGYKIHIESIAYRIGMYANFGINSQIGHVPVRLMLVLDKETHGSSAAVTDVLQSANINAFMNIGNSSRFQVLKTWEINMLRKPVWNGLTDQLEQCQDSYQDTGYLDFKKNPIKVTWATSNTDGAVSGMTTNNIFLLMIGNNTFGRLDNNLTSFRIRFMR